MSLQHNDFNEKKASLIGSPMVARKAVVDRVTSVQAETRATGDSSARTAVFFHHAPVNHAPVDPVRHPAELCQSVRVFASTECQISRLSRIMGFTFWGEAVALILSYAATFPEEFGVADLKTPELERLLKVRGGRAKVNVAGVVGIQAPLTPETAAFVARIARQQKLTREAAASLILHRHVARVLSLIAGASS